MISIFTDFKLWDMGDRLQTYWVLSKITFATSYSIKKRALSITLMGAMSHATAIPQLQWCYPVIVYNKHLVMVISFVSHAAIGIVQ